MRQRIDEVGKRYGRLLVIAHAGTDRLGKALYRCLCDCGQEKILRGYDLRRDRTRSCGCLNRSHGHARRGKISPTYITWRNMLARCYYPKNKEFRSYGGRGISVCARWFKFENFLADMGECPPGLTIERINYHGHYMPSNCVWDTWARQANNRRNNHRVTIGNETKTLAQWCKIYGISSDVVGSRLNRYGWSEDQALLTPVRAKRKTALLAA